MNKVFVSYKYADSSVQRLNTGNYFGYTTVRDYVTYFENKVNRNSIAIYKGESDGEDLSHLSENQIWEKLKDKIYDSSVTILFISPNMREVGKKDEDQWIPWEIAFSLREQTRKDRVSRSNALLYVILPNEAGIYSYKTWMTHFDIVKSNEDNGFAEVVQWNSFINNIQYYIDRAIKRKEQTPSYKIVKTV